MLAAEVLVVTGTVREAIKRPEGNPPLKELMEKGVHPYGMQTFEMHLKQLVAQGIIDREARAGATRVLSPRHLRPAPEVRDS